LPICGHLFTGAAQPEKNCKDGCVDGGTHFARGVENKYFQLQRDSRSHKGCVLRAQARLCHSVPFFWSYLHPSKTGCTISTASQINEKLQLNGDWIQAIFKDDLTLYDLLPEVEHLSLQLAAVAGVTVCETNQVNLDLILAEHNYVIGKSKNFLPLGILLYLV